MNKKKDSYLLHLKVLSLATPKIPTNEATRTKQNKWLQYPSINCQLLKLNSMAVKFCSIS